jgi:hypothetical protein
MSNRQILFLSFCTFVTVLVWIASDIYHAATTSTVTAVQEKLMTPLNPKLDTEVIARLKKGL